jgi:hypothetical protein
MGEGMTMRTPDEIFNSPTPRGRRAQEKELRVLTHALDREEKEFQRQHGRAMRQAAFRAVRQGCAAGWRGETVEAPADTQRQPVAIDE